MTNCDLSFSSPFVFFFSLLLLPLLLLQFPLLQNMTPSAAITETLISEQQICTTEKVLHRLLLQSLCKMARSELSEIPKDPSCRKLYNKNTPAYFFRLLPSSEVCASVFWTSSLV